MATLTPEQRQQKFERIALGVAKIKLDRLEKNYETVSRLFSTRYTVRRSVQEVINALRHFEETMADGYMDDAEPDDDFDEDDEDLGRPVLL